MFQFYVCSDVVYMSRVQPLCKSLGSGWATDGARVEEGVGTVGVSPNFGVLTP